MCDHGGVVERPLTPRRAPDGRAAADCILRARPDRAIHAHGPRCAT
ncbi:hypothetical protein [Lysobacter gummosus]